MICNACGNIGPPLTTKGFDNGDGTFSHEWRCSCFNIRMRSIENAKGWKEFYKHLTEFMGCNNFSREEMSTINHTLNSFYFMGRKLEILRGDDDE